MATPLPELQLPGGRQELVLFGVVQQPSVCLQGGLENLHMLADQLKRGFFSLTQPHGQLH